MEKQANKMTEQEVQASSIGNTFPPTIASNLYDRGNNRLKGFYTISIEEEEHLLRVFSEILEVKEGIKILGEGEVSRITARFLVNKRVNLPEELREDVEAQISLDGEFAEYNLVYLGRNFDGRVAREDVIARQRTRAHEIDQRTPFSGTNSLDLIKREDVIVRTVKPSPDKDIFEAFTREVLDLYQSSFFGDYAFPMTLESVASLLRRDTNIVKIIQDRKTCRLLSIGVGETISLPLQINGSQSAFNMAEISDAATPKEYRGRGYYSTIAGELTRELLKAGVDLVYGEARAASPPVMTVCKKTGRRVARDYYGMPALLHKHCIISGAKDETLDDSDKNGRYKGLENLAVWYATRNQLMELYVPK